MPKTKLAPKRRPLTAEEREIGALQRIVDAMPGGIVARKGDRINISGEIFSRDVAHSFFGQVPEELLEPSQFALYCANAAPELLALRAYRARVVKALPQHPEYEHDIRIIDVTLSAMVKTIREAVRRGWAAFHVVSRKFDKLHPDGFKICGQKFHNAHTAAFALATQVADIFDRRGGAELSFGRKEQDELGNVIRRDVEAVEANGTQGPAANDWTGAASPSEFASEYGISPNTLRRWIKKKLIRVDRISTKSIRVNRIDHERFKKNN